MSLNKFIGIGRLTKEPELKCTESGKQYLRFDIAIDEGKDSDGNKREATFVPCVLWDKKAETFSVYVHKGHRVLVEGKYRVDKYVGEDGKNIYRTYIWVNNFEFLESKPKEEFVPQEPDYITKTSYKNEEIDAIPMENDPFASATTIQDSDLPF